MKPDLSSGFGTDALRIRVSTSHQSTEERCDKRRFGLDHPRDLSLAVPLKFLYRSHARLVRARKSRRLGGEGRMYPVMMRWWGKVWARDFSQQPTPVVQCSQEVSPRLTPKKKMIMGRNSIGKDKKNGSKDEILQFNY